MVELTSVQKKAVEFILSHIEDTGMPPTLREIASYFQWKAVGSAQDVVAALRKKGILLAPSPGKARQIVPAPELLQGLFHPDVEISAMQGERTKSSIRKQIVKTSPIYDKVLPGFEDLFRVPLLGTVQAGYPAEAIQNPAEYVAFPAVSRDKLRGGALFALTVEGYSMLNAGFLPGDRILVEICLDARDKDIVVAKVQDNEVTVKRFAVKGSLLYRSVNSLLDKKYLPPAFLVPENSDFDAIPFGTQENDRIVGVVRALFREHVL